MTNWGAKSERRIQRLVNRHFSMARLLRAFGIEVTEGEDANIRCPVHEDHRKSAKYFASNHLWCWSCQKVFRPYDLLGFMGVSETDMIRQLRQTGVLNQDPEEDEEPELWSIFAEETEEDRVRLRSQFVKARIPFPDYLRAVMGFLRSPEPESRTDDGRRDVDA